MTAEHLAVNGGQPVRTEPFPPRGLFGEAEQEAVVDLFETARETGEAFTYEGPAETAYCEELADYMGGGFADGVNSGTSAVYVALRALELEPFTEVVVSPITDPGGQMPVALQGCVPVPADAAPGTYNTGPEQVADAITPRTSAICVGHIMGEPLDMHGIMDVAAAHDLPVVEDVAQAHGARLDGQLVGTFGDLAAFSTMGSKHHATGGQGGVVYTGDEELYWRSRRLSDRGKPFGLDEETNVAASLNLNLGDLPAAVGRVQLEKLPGIVERRRELVAAIRERIEPLPGVSVPEQVPGAEPSYWYWRLGIETSELTCDKVTFCRALSAEGLPVQTRYDSRQHTAEWFREQRVFGETGYPWTAPEYDGPADPEPDCPNAAAVLDRCFNLAVRESWGEDEVADIVDAFEKVAASYARAG